MPTVGARLKNDGTLLTAGEFEENGIEGVSQRASGHGITVNNVFADELDEITLDDGEPSGGSLKLNGTSQRIDIAGSGDFQFGTGDFCVEGWFYLRSTNYTRLWCFPDGDNVEVNGTNVYYWNGGGSVVASGNNTIQAFQWYHIALVKSSGIAKVYVNGVAKITDNSPFNSQTSRALSIGGEASAGDITGQSGVSGADGWMDGYFTNFRVVKGSPVYTDNFSPVYSPLANITNTKLLLKVSTQASMLTDSSGTGKSVSNVGSAVYDALTPLSTIYNGAMKQKSNGTLQVAYEFDEVTTIT